ncbi:MAG: outer membrane beta-barrel protein [Spirochaetota bacterium]
MTKNIKIVMLGICFMAGGLFAQDAKAPEKKWYDKVEFSGFVDVYYQYNTNNKQGANVDGSRPFTTYNKQFGVNSVELAVEKAADKESPWGFRINFMNGQNAMFQENGYTTTNQVFNMNLLQEGYVSFYFNVLNGLTVDVGKMATHIGYELIESMDNPNYTIGYIFFNTIPFIHTGARASLSINDKWGFNFYLYNSAKGTGFSEPTEANLTNGNVHTYADGPNKARAIGTQLSGELSSKLSVVWNTVYGSDNETARRSNMDYFIQQNNAQLASNTRPNSWNHDYWFVNEIILSISPTDKLTVDLDWTYGEKKGTDAGANEGVDRQVTLEDGSQPTLPLNRDGRNARTIYNTYGVWAKYTINDKFLLALRYEYIDDSRNGGALGTSGNIPQFRYDLQYMNSTFGSKQNYGTQVRTFTVTPTYNWSDNMIIKLDLRRDWALGYQFVDEQGRPASYQNGATLGIVAKF